VLEAIENSGPAPLFSSVMNFCFFPDGSHPPLSALAPAAGALYVATTLPRASADGIGHAERE